jgi:ankyrin repeat protein
VHCQVPYLRGCHPGRIRQALAELPEALNETYERTLREINKADWELAHRLFQSVVVASRPLRVEELAEFLAFDFNAGPTPRFNKGWRLEDPINAVLSTCSSLLAVVDIGDSQIIQFSHSSVKEFLTSSRLAKANQEISLYHVSMTPAHTLLAKACLGILLHLDNNVAENALQKFPLAPYAALHWVDHARFEGVSPNIEDGMNTLFDPRKPHLAVWVSLHNTELPSWKLFKRGERPLPTSGTPLHYAAICGLHALVKVLVVERPRDVDSRGLDNLTPLHMASLRGNVEVARILLEHDADVTAQNDDNQTPLHVASREGHLQVVRALLEHGASTTARDKVGSTPLHLALQPRDAEDPHVPNSGADARAEGDGENRLAQLHGASHIDFLSYLFSQGASVQVTRDLPERGVHKAAQRSTSSPVTMRHIFTGPPPFHPKPETDAMIGDNIERNHLESRSRHAEVAQLLVEHGADLTARDNNGCCPLHFASLSGYMELVQFLVEYGADPTAQDKDGWTPLHSASKNGHVDVVRLLVEHGADLTAQDKDGWTPLRLASQNGHAETVQFLIEHDAERPDRPLIMSDGWIIVAR